MKNKIKFIVLALIISTVAVPSSYAQGVEDDVTLLLDPASGDYEVGDTVEVDVILDTGETLTDQVDLVITYPADLLEVQDADNDTDGVQIEVGALFQVDMINDADNTEGKVEYSHVTLIPESYYASNGEPGIVATIEFLALATGDAEVEIVFDEVDPNAIDDSNVLLGDATTDTDIITEVSGASFTIAEGEAMEEEETEEDIGTVYSISLTSNKLNLTANGADTADVTAVLTDDVGTYLADAEVSFSVSGSGTITPVTNTTNANGEAMTTYTAGFETGTESITATLMSDSTISTTLDLSLTTIMPTDEGTGGDEVVEEVETPEAQSETGASTGLLLGVSILGAVVYMYREKIFAR